MFRALFIFVTLATLWSGYVDARPRGAPQTIFNGGMGVNLGNGGFGNPVSQFLNWWLLGSTFNLVSTVNGSMDGSTIWNCPSDCSTPTTYFDASTGELVSPVPSDVTSFSRAFFTDVLWPQYQYEGSAFTWAGQQFDVAWDGCANPAVSIWTVGSLGTGGSSSFGSNSGTLTFGSSGYGNVGLTFTLAGIPACYADPPRNIRVYQHQYAADVAAGEVFNPDWIAALKPAVPFGFIRLMDWMQTNFNAINEASQLADLNYNSITNTFNMAVGTGSVTGSTLTISSFTRGSPFRSGQRIVCIGCTNTATIISQASGTPGGAGTYNLSASSPASSTTVMGIIPAGGNAGRGPKGGIAPSAVCTLAQKLQANIEYPIPVAASNQFVTDVATAFKACMPAGLIVKYSYGNENWNFGFNTYRYMQAQPTANYSGYRAAEIMEIIAGVYGTNSWHWVNNPASRWMGAIGSQLADTAVSSGNISGAMAWINSSPSTLTLPQLFTTLDVAPYWGEFYGGACISNITAGATPTVTINSGTSCSSFTNFTNGQSVRMFVNGGTMAGVLNNVDVTVSGYSGGNTFQINVDTTGLTYGGSLNGVLDSAIFKLADQSTALNISTPATYPSKFSYFNQQYAKAILNGSASDASYGTITIGSAVNLTTNTNSILDFFQRHALIAQTNSLELSQYEGGFGATFVGNAQGNIQSLGLGIEFLGINQFFAPVTGDAVNTLANTYATAYSQFDSVNGAYPYQFTDTGQISQFGPWAAVRFFPGDDTNPKWTSVKTKNAAGRYVPPSPPSAWTATYPGASNFYTAAGSCSNPCTDTLNNVVVGTAATSIKVLATLAGGSITSVTCDGVTVSTPDVTTSVARTAAIYTIPVGAGTNLRNCSFLTASTSFQRREFYVITVSGLTAPNVPTATATAGGTATIAYTKQSLLLNVTACNTGTYSSTSGISPASGIPTTTTAFSDTSASITKMGAFSAAFSAAKFSMAPGCNFGSSSAVYNFLLKRDLDPASNDNDPMWLEKAA